MGFIRQTWTLVEKTLLVVLWRNWLGTSILCFFAPIIFIFIIAYSKNFFVPPANFGIGSPTPIRSLYDAVSVSAGGRNTVAFINNGFTGGQIEAVINQVSEPFRAAGKEVRVLTRPNDVLTVCPSTIRGVTPCFAGVVFHSSPTEGNGRIWNYTMRADGSFGTNIYVERSNNDAQIYTIPLQRAIDNAIASLNGVSLPAIIDEYPYTSQNAAERDRNITRLYMGTLISILGVVYFVGIVGVCYQLPGHMAEERESGMSSLIESMMSTPRTFIPQAARLLSLHISFDLMYLPSWVIMSLIVARLNYPVSSAGIMVGFYIISGLSLSSWSTAFASFFRKAQLSGITVTITSIVLAILIQVIPPPSTGAVIILSLIFPPINFTIFIIYMAYWQQQSLAARLGEAAPDAPWRVPGYLFFVFAFIHIIAYPLVAFLIERIRYGTASKSRQLVYSGDATPEAVKITSLNKVYPPNRLWAAIGRRFPRFARPAVHAVNDLSLSVLRGQITVLLGANGSGKSTTLDMLAGLQKPTSGNIEIDATGGIGLCPQKNVLWDDLTVYEHVRIFNRLKSEKIDSRAELEALIAACDLEQKKKARSETLSGGQKRKCQLAMMLTGGSSLCMLDEVSSGLDPLSRRKIWDIILAERGKRSILMTTHFLDEADLLSDDIAILSKGRLVANSSAVELKHHLGGGYRVKIYHENTKDLPAELSTVPSQTLADHTVFNLTSSASAADFIARLEHAGVREYQVNGPSIEDVFLKLAEEVRDDLEKDRVVLSSASGSEEYIREEKPLKLVPGKTLSFFGQTWVLFRKRAIILRRNSWPYLAALLIPIITAGLTALFIKNFKGLSCDPADQVALTPISASLENYLAIGARIITGPDVNQTFLTQMYPLLNSSSYRNVSSFGQFQDLLNRNYSRIRPGGIYLGDTPTFAWRGDYSLYWAMAVQNLLDISLLRIPIVASYDSFDLPFSPEAGKSLQLILYFGLAMSAFPGFFALYVNVERTRNVRALHYSNGVRAGPLWLAYTLFDFLIVLLVSAISIIIYTSASKIWYAPGYLFVVFALYGLAATLMSYVASLFTKSQLATFIIAAGGQCALLLLYFIAFLVILTYTPAADVDSHLSIANYAIGAFFPAGNLLRALLLSLNEFSLLCRGGTEVAPYPGAIGIYGAPILYLTIQSALLFTFLVLWDSGWKPTFLMRSKHRSADQEEIEDVDPEVYEEARRVDSSNDELRVKHVTKAFGSNVAVEDVSFGVPRSEIFALLGPNGAGKSTTIGLIRGDTRPSDKISEILIENNSILRSRATARSHLGVCPQFDAMDQMTAVEHLRFYAQVRGVRDVENNVEEVIKAVGLGPFKSRMAAKLSGGNKRKLSLGIALMGDPSVLLLDEPSSGMDAASKRVMWRTLASVSDGRSLVLTTHSMEEADALADRAGIMAKRMLALGTADQLRKKHGDAYHVHLVHRDAPYTSDEAMDEIKAFVRRTFAGATTEERAFHGQLRFSVPNTHNIEEDTSSMDDAADDKKGGVRSTVTSSSGSSISALFAQLEANKENLGFQYYSVSQATLDQVFLNIVTKHNVLEENYARTHAKKRKFPKNLLAACCIY